MICWTVLLECFTPRVKCMSSVNKVLVDKYYQFTTVQCHQGGSKGQPNCLQVFAGLDEILLLKTFGTEN